MSSRSRGSAERPVAIALCLMLACVAVAVFAAASAYASEYKMVNCAANSGAPPYTIASNTGIFTFENDCIGQGGDPPGNASFLRISEHESGGNAAYAAYLDVNFQTPSWVTFRSAGGYTREPNAFNDGWQARFGLTYLNGTPQLQMVQGRGLQGVGLGYFGTTSSFASHLWPWSYPLDFYRWTLELVCARPAGCDRSNYNAVDLNGIVFTLRDGQDSQVGFTNTGSELMRGQWVRGSQNVTWQSSDNGSGLRFERLRVDGAERYVLDYQAIGSCDTSYTSTNGEFARKFQPCPTGGPYGRSYSLNTAGLGDGAHSVSACTQDFGQYQGLNGTGSQSCTQRTIRTDNHAPGAPSGMRILTSNPNRYQRQFGAKFALPPDPGSPITKLHYYVADTSGNPVMPAQVLTTTNPTEIPAISGPGSPGAYRLRVWLEDSVGFTGQIAEVDVPHDAKPPAAPQDLRVVGTTAHRVPRFDLRWRNIVDAGSPIDAAHYQLIDGSGSVVAATRTVHGHNVQELHEIETPPRAGDYKVRVWLSDEEGNVGASSTVVVPRDTTPPAAPQGLSVTPPQTPREADGFDLRWHDIADAGSPIDAAHYQVLDASGKVAVPTQTARGEGIEEIANLDAPSRSGPHTLRLWLEDGEGNVGAPVTVPLAYGCVRSEASGGRALSAGLGARGAGEAVVRQGKGSLLRGRLSGRGGAVASAVLCVFGRVVTERRREFLGFAVSGPDGRYRFPIGAGPSRELSVLYRSGHREVGARAVLGTVVRPIFKVRKKIVRNKHYAKFTGRIPGPDNDRVIVVLQVRRGKGWLAFRRYRTRHGGKVTVGYRFTRTEAPTKYVMRAQVRSQAGYPYLQGNSRHLKLIVLPKRGRR
jgi:hypothetical protein